MNENTNEINKSKIKFFLREQLKAHLDLKNGTFLNGIFIKEFDGDIYLFDDAVLGEQHITLDEVRTINTFREPPKERFKTNNF